MSCILLLGTAFARSVIGGDHKMSENENESDLNASFESVFGRKWLLIIGILVTVAAIGFFLKYSFERNWLGPAARVCMSCAAGFALLAGGEISRRRNFAMFGLYLIGGGIAALYFSTYAAFQMYHLIIQPVSILLMALVTALACGLAVAYDAIWLAVLGLIGGFLTPKFLGVSSPNPVGLLSYLAVLNAGMLYVAFQKEWRSLNYAGFLFTYGLFTDWYVTFYRPDQFWPVILFLNFFFLVYSIGVSKEFLIFTPNTFVSFLYSFVMIRERFSTEWVGLVTLSYAGIFLTLAEWRRRKRRDAPESYAILLGQAILFFILTVPIVFSNQAITIFWAAQGFSILWVGLKLNRNPIAALGWLLLMASVFKFLVHDLYQVFGLATDGLYFTRGYATLMMDRWATELTVMAALLAAAWRCRSAAVAESNLFFALSGLLSFAVLNIEVSAACHDYFARGKFAAVSVLWALYALSIMGLGVRLNRPPLRHIALALFAVTTFKVFLIDMSNVSTPFRILSCAFLGLALIYASYLYHKHRADIFPSS